MRRFIAVLAFAPSLAFAACSGSSPTLTAASTSYTDVNACVTAAVDGDTINIPAGSSNWSGSIISTSKGINIIGAGGVSSDATTLTNSSFSMSAPNGKSFRLSAFTMTGTGNITVAGASKALRIDHIHFSSVTGNSSSRIVYVRAADGASLQGVIDHNFFDDPQTSMIMVQDTNGDGGNDSWSRAADLGGPDAIYIEDNTFTMPNYVASSAITDCSEGGRFVFRYNTVTNTYVQWHDAIVTGQRGCRKEEIYNNTFHIVSSTPNPNWWLDMRGGTSIVFNNVGYGTTDNAEIQVALYRANGVSGGDPWVPLCSNSSGKACLGTSGAGVYPRACTTDANCSGSTGACVNIDATAGSPTGYPCRDQTGWSGNGTRVSEPSLYWNNKYDSGGDLRFTTGSVGAAGYLTDGVDYCYSSTTKPTTCNGASVTYTPYTYPHPLVGGSHGPTNFHYIPVEAWPLYFAMLVSEPWH